MHPQHHRGEPVAPVQEIEQFDRFWATFQPRRTDDLKSGARAFIGRRLEWEAAYILDDEGDPDAYRGQFACTLAVAPPEHPGFVWVPECDLADVVMIEDSP